MTDFPSLFSDFNNGETTFSSHDKSSNTKRPETIRLSVRVTPDEKAQLVKAAGSLALSAYIRQQLFGDDVVERPKRHLKKQHQPQLDHKVLGQLLGTFGASELGRSMLALCIAVQQHELEVTPDIADKLEQACDDIHEMKMALIMVLGVKPQGQESASKDRCGA